MSIISSCAGTTAGTAVLACFSSAAEYLIGYAILIGLFLILYFKLLVEPTRDRVAASVLVVSIIAMIFAALGFIPETSWSITLVLAIGSGAILALKRT